MYYLIAIESRERGLHTFKNNLGLTATLHAIENYCKHYNLKPTSVKIKLVSSIN